MTAASAPSFNVDYFVALEDKGSIPPPPEALMGFSYVTQQLAQGSAPPPERELPFDLVVLAAGEYQPSQAQFPRTTLIHAPLDDAMPSRAEVALAKQVALTIVNALQRGQRVLVTCFMGRNRSGFINGLVLITLGWSSLDAVTMIRNARGENALTNPHFVEVLHEYAIHLGRGSRPELM